MSLIYNVKKVRAFQSGGKPIAEPVAYDIPVNVENSESADVVEKRMALEKAQRADRIGRTQEILIANGFLSGLGDQQADKILGPNTDGAIKKVKSMQKMLGVRADGIIGKKTIKAAAEKGVNIKEVAAILNRKPEKSIGILYK